MKKLLYGFFLISILSIVILAGCSSDDKADTTDAPGKTDKADKAENRELIIATVREPDTIDVHNTTWVDDANTHLYNTLFNSENDGSVVPGLVDEYTVSEDYKSVAFKLKEGKTFHDGKPITADDVVKSLQRYIDVSAGSHMGPVEKMVAIDELNFEIHWTEPFAPFFSNATVAYLGIIDTSVLDADNMGFEKNPNGSGPLKHVETKRGESIVYEPFEGFDWGDKGKPDFDKVTFRFIPDDETRILEFKKGTIHALTDVPPQYIKDLEADSDVTVEKILDSGNTYLGFNMKRPIFEDVRVRQAIAMGIDRDPIINQALQGAAQPIYGPLPSTIFGYSDKVEKEAEQKYGRDVEGAKSLLAEAGWNETNKDGVATKDGKPFTFELWMTDEPVMQRIGQIVQNQLKEIGIDVKLVVKEDAAIRAQTPEGAHEAVLWQYGWYDADILNALFGAGNSTRMHWEPEELDIMLKKARSEMDMDQRLLDYEDVQRYLVEESPWVPLFVREKVTAYRGVENLTKHPIKDVFVWDGTRIGN